MAFAICLLVGGFFTGFGIYRLVFPPKLLPGMINVWWFYLLIGGMFFSVSWAIVELHKEKNKKN